MSTGPMQYGASNDAGLDQTYLFSGIPVGHEATLFVVNGASSINPGIHAGVAVAADSFAGDAIYGRAAAPGGANGVMGEAIGTSSSARGVYGYATGVDGVGVYGEAINGPNAVGVLGRSVFSGLAGFFQGSVRVAGDLAVTNTLTKGTNHFKIDHPLDPENKYLLHSAVESPDALNVYSDTVSTDSDGYATVVLPEYFAALNTDFRYQLTVIGEFAQAIVAEEIRDNRFTIRTDRPNIRVSWQVTGVRNDPFAKSHRVLVEEEKPEVERGTYLHPKAYGKPENQGVEYAGLNR